MSKIYTRPGPSDKAWSIMKNVISLYHPDLDECNARIAIVMVESEDPDQPALTHGGYAATAKVKLTTALEKAVMGQDKMDAVIQIAYEEWKLMNDDQRAALIDHELCHIGYSGEQDEFLRPRLKIVKGDYHIGDGFIRVAERHGENAMEWRAARHHLSLRDEDGNLLFGFMTAEKA